MPADPSAPDTVSVTSLDAEGRQAAGGQVYLPVLPEFLTPGSPLDFDLYQRVGTDRLRLLLSEGEDVTESVAVGARTPPAAMRLYARAEQRDRLLRHQERSIPRILGDPTIPVEKRCEAVHSLTTGLSQQMFESPTAINLDWQRQNVSRMVEFAIAEPDAVKGLMRLTSHDYYTYTHSVNVGTYGLAIALAHFGTETQQHNLREVVVAFYLHDIGKCSVRQGVINKPGPLDESEWAEMRRHPRYGYNILEREKIMTSELRTVVLQHHERMDGFGYPDALNGARIHPYARVCSIADAFDALTTNRSYKKARKSFEALHIMKDEMHAQFDPDIFRTFVLLMQKKGIG